MFHPPTYQAESLDFSDERLDAPLQCMCGKEVKLRDCLACWTTSPNDKEPGWYAACNGFCIVAHVTEGNA